MTRHPAVTSLVVVALHACSYAEPVGIPIVSIEIQQSASDTLTLLPDGGVIASGVDSGAALEPVPCSVPRDQIDPVAPSDAAVFAGDEAALLLSVSGAGTHAWIELEVGGAFEAQTYQARAAADGSLILSRSVRAIAAGVGTVVVRARGAEPVSRSLQVGNRSLHLDRVAFAGLDDGVPVYDVDVCVAARSGAVQSRASEGTILGANAEGWATTTVARATTGLCARGEPSWARFRWRGDAEALRWSLRMEGAPARDVSFSLVGHTTLVPEWSASGWRREGGDWRQSFRTVLVTTTSTAIDGGIECQQTIARNAAVSVASTGTARVEPASGLRTDGAGVLAFDLRIPIADGGVPTTDAGGAEDAGVGAGEDQILVTVSAGVVGAYVLHVAPPPTR